MNMRVALTLLLVAASLGVADEQAEVSRRLAESFPRVLELRARGVLGETWQGYLGVPREADAAARALMESVNRDRRRLYELIAAREQATLASVEQRAGQRNFQRARVGDYLQTRDGVWRRRAG